MRVPRVVATSLAVATASCAPATKKDAQPVATVADHAAVAPPTVDAGRSEAGDEPTEPVSDAKPGFSAEEMRRVVLLHLPEIRKCYESGLDAVPGLKGSLTVAWHITATGLVSRSSVVSSSLKYLPVEDCIAKAVRTWVFQNPNAVEADATWGFQFTPP